jgi:MFS transporter, PPP family, 3-phenylpropionic acid transporter
MTTALSIPPTTAKRSLTIMWALYFLFYAGVGVSLTFLNVYYQSVGLTGVQIGLLGTVGAIGSIVSPSLFGQISDRTGKNRWILAGCAVATGLIALMIPVAHSIPAYMVISLFFGFFNSALFTIIDTTTLALLGDRREEYGRYRLGGSFGYILVTATIGFVFERYGLQLMFPIYAVVMVIFVSVSLLLPILPIHVGQQNKGQVGKMLRQPTWIIFAICVFLIFVAFNGTLSFLGVTIKSMGGSDALVGLAATMSAITEIPFMYFSGNLLRRFGASNMMWFSMFFFTIRTTLYAFMPNPAWAVGINCLNGITYVFFWNSAVNYANQNAPKALKATSLGILVSMTNISGLVSALISGWLFDNYGPNGLFKVLGACCFAAFVLFGISRLRPTSPVVLESTPG